MAKHHVTTHVDPSPSAGSIATVPDGPRDPNTTVTLTATASAGYAFVEWQGDLTGSINPQPLILNGNKTVTAVFQPIHALTVSGSNGSVAKSPDQSDYADGDTVQLTATPSAGYVFQQWSGDLAGAANPASILMDGDKTVTAEFVPDYIEDQDSSSQDEADDLSDADLTVNRTVSGQKHLHLEVPNYEATTPTHAPNTYLRLGAAIPLGDQGRSTGDDMLDLVGVPTSAVPYFKDDYRRQNGQTHPSTSYTRWDGVTKTSSTGVDAPKQLNAELRTRGGWRQHTDGNFLSTTRGDRVDVYYGNYKMVVLGRMDITGSSPDWGETYWESSGGHTRWATNTQGDMVLVRWNADRGRWRIYEETVKGDLIDRYQGVVEEIYEGPRMVTMIGSPDAAGTAIPSVDKDPHTQLTTDADGTKVKHYPVGYSGKWVKPGGRLKERPNVTERVDAKKIKSTTKVTSGMATNVTECSDTRSLTTMNVSGFTKASTLDFDNERPPVGAVVSYKKVLTKADEKIFTVGGRVYETLTVDSGVTIGDETGFAPANAKTSTADAVRVDDVSDLLFCFGKVSSDISHITKNSGFGGWTFNFSLVGAAVDIGFGTSVTIPNFDKGGDAFRRELGLSWSSNYDLTFSLSLAVNIGVELKFALVHKLEADLAGGDDYALLAAKFGVSKKKLTAVESSQKGVDNQLSANTQTT